MALWIRFLSDGEEEDEKGEAGEEYESLQIFHYLLSVTEETQVTTQGFRWGQRETGSVWEGSQLQIFLPSEAHAAHGVARGILRDSGDVQPGNRAFLDSDGVVSFNGPRAR